MSGPVKERDYHAVSGWVPLLVVLALFVLAGYLFFESINVPDPPNARLMTMSAVTLVLFILGVGGFIAIPPKEGRVLLLFGKYQGTVKTDGFYWVNPFFSRKKISLRIRNFETGQQNTPEVTDAEGNVKQSASVQRRPTKVNDRDGNPIEISAIVVWRVVNTAEAVFEVDHYEDYVHLQSEAALRVLASRFPYDSSDEEMSLRRTTSEISDQLKREIDERLHKAGVEVLEARINQLAYSPEIAAAMLQRQQAHAVVAARAKIVEGAVGMVEMALDHLSKNGVVELEGERRAAMVSSLLVVLCGDRHVQPVLSTGSTQ
jgi:regulator of protease activity HflC (stomatin/prohibitin superfamily)